MVDKELAAKYAAASLTDRELRDAIRWYEQADESEKDETDHILYRANVVEWGWRQDK